jgi:DNA-binding LytR/AlgR family response regulator
MNIRCIIVDDEPLAREILEQYISDTPHLDLITSCRNALEAIHVLSENSVDLLFLDINMPKLNGINFIKSLEKAPEVIFTTAYSEFAVEGFELSAIDYLVKPFGFERFLKAVEKARTRLRETITEDKEKFLMVKADKRLYKLAIKDISYIEALGDFVKVHTHEKVYITSGTLKEYMHKLANQGFLQIHKSYIVALHAITFLDGNQVSVKDAFLPVGHTYKQHLLDELNEAN